MKQFDDIFREKVEKAFSNYNAGHMADEGWNSFIAARKGRRRILAIFPLWARAASLLIIIGLGLFLAYRISTRQVSQELIAVSESQAVKETIASKAMETAKPDLPAAPTLGRPLLQKRQIEPTKIAAVQQPVVEIEEPARIMLTIHDTIQVRVPAEELILDQDYVADQQAAEELKEFPGIAGKEPVTEEPEKRTGRRTLMAGFSGLMAQAGEAASSTSGVSVGLYLEQKITERISVRPGLALAMHSLGLEDNTRTSGFNYSVPLYDGTSGRLDAYNGRLSMLAMELPLNVVFRIFEKDRSGLYVSAGASTLIYLNQQFTAEYVNEYTKQTYNTMSGEFSTETRYSMVEVENDYGAFRHSDLFGLANISAGYSFPYSKTAVLLIEPFVQLPLGDLTSLNLRVRYGGVSMKVRFGNQVSDR